MKNLHLKIFSLIIMITLTVGSVFAYQTLAFDFPSGTGNWTAVYHKTRGSETIIQYVPYGQSYANWQQALILHSYNNSSVQSASDLLRKLTTQLYYLNSYSKYEYERITSSDAIATRCVVGNNRITAQCDIYRSMKSFNGYITMHYINKDIEGFKNNYFNWLDSIKNAKPYYSEFRNDRYMNKSFTFEL